MARKKVKLQFIENDTARKVTYKKRVRGLVKKTQELSILCGVDVCTIVYSPYDEAPVVWPSSEVEASRILVEYKRKPDLDQQSQRKLTQEGFLKQSVTKSEERFLRLQRRNREMDMENLMSDLLCGKPVQQVQFDDIEDLIWVIEDKLRSVQHRMRVMKGDAPAPARAPAATSNLNLNTLFGNESMGGTSANWGGNGGTPFEPQSGPYYHQHRS
ncbi:agamous-like MADS-box protein AGL80 [Silene latifolia]|uniref:agamous-like MADS-box protein AGL80 n=1 Tax=Silene latifolia TaxID=37657 RepID=UPI003D771388